MEIIAKLHLPIGVPSSRTGRIYPREEVERAVAEFSERCKDDAMYGMVVGDRTAPGEYEGIEKISHKVNKVWWSEDDIMVSIDIFETPKGKMIKDMMQADIPYKLYPAGVGIRNDDNVISEYKLIGVDIEMGGYNDNS